MAWCASWYQENRRSSHVVVGGRRGRRRWPQDTRKELSANARSTIGCSTLSGIRNVLVPLDEAPISVLALGAGHPMGACERGSHHAYQSGSRWPPLCTKLSYLASHTALFRRGIPPRSRAPHCSGRLA